MAQYDNDWVWRFSSCEKKKAYPDRHSAETMAGQQTKKSKTQIKAYKCRFCPNWHIGHTKSPTPNGPKVFCLPCLEKIPQDQYDQHYKKTHLAKPKQT